nr:hypothetical protein [uncultured Desulfobacter sp.]
MKKSSIIVAACLMVCGLFLTQPAFAALYSGPWATDGGSIFTIDGTDSVFGFYDYNAEIATYYDLASGVNELFISGDQVTVNGTSSITFTLNEGVAQFGFYMKEDNSSTLTFYKEADVNFDSITGLYTLSFDSGKSALALYNAVKSNVDPVSETPVPAAALLLGSGLVGLVGFKRKTSNS